MTEKEMKKKSELQKLILDLYEMADSNYGVIGTQKVQIMSLSIYGLAFLITFVTLIYYLLKDNLLIDIRAIWFVGILTLLTVLVFAGIAWYFLFLHKIQRVNAITTLLLEKLLSELISGTKTEDEIMNEIYKFLPQSRLANKLKVLEKKWFIGSLKTEYEKELIEYLSKMKE